MTDEFKTSQTCATVQSNQLCGCRLAGVLDPREGHTLRRCRVQSNNIIRKGRKPYLPVRVERGIKHATTCRTFVDRDVTSGLLIAIAGEGEHRFGAAGRPTVLCRPRDNKRAEKAVACTCFTLGLPQVGRARKARKNLT